MFLAFAAASFASGFAMRVADPIVLPVAQHLSVDAATAALLSPAYVLPYALGQLFLGPLGDRFGKQRCMQVCGVGLALSLALGAFAASFALLMASRIVAGVFAGGLIPLVLAAMGEKPDLVERQVMIGRMLFAIIGGQMAGSAMAGVACQAWGWRSPLILAAVVAAVGAMALLRMPPAPRVRPADGVARPSVFGLYGLVLRHPKAAWIYACALAEGLLFFCLFPFVGALLQSRSSADAAAAASQAGLVLGAFGLGGLVYALAVRRLIAALGVRRMCLLGSVVSAGCYAAMTASMPWEACAALMLLAGLGFYMIHNSLQTQVTELAAAARGSAVALFAFGFFAGQGIGPLVAGPLIQSVGFGLLLLAVAAGMVVLGQVVVRRIVRPGGVAAPVLGSAARH